jgi:vacuolar-type H+-ATPase subunit E/Vma4
VSDTQNENRPEELISRIRAEAEGEAEKIRTETEKSIAERKASLEKRIAEIREQTDARIAEEREQLVSRADAQITLLEGRAALRREDRIYREATDRTRQAIRDLRGSDGYTEMLAEWIVEAALGLGAEEATVLAPEADQPFLEEAIAAARQKLETSAAEVSLRPDTSIAVSGQGVVIRDLAGRRSFSNLVEDRLRRYGTDLRQIVYHEVIEDKP